MFTLNDYQSMATAKIIRYISKKPDEGRNPILLQIIAERKIKKISLGNDFFCLGDQWDANKREFTRNFPNCKERNKTIKNLEVRAVGIIDDFLRTGKPFTFKAFEDTFRGSIKNAPNVYDLFDELIGEMKEKGKIGNANVYTDTKRVLKKFEPSPKLMLPDIDYKFLTRFENHLLTTGCTDGGVIVYMRTIRAAINESIRREYLSKELYPFKNQFSNGGYTFSHLQSTAQPRALSEMDLNKIKAFSTAEQPHLNFAYKLFMFSFYSRGMNFYDIAELKRKDIYNGRINYNRSKTGKFFTINVSEPLKMIVDEFYTEGSDFVFPILSDFHKTPQQMKDRINKVQKKVNQNLKEICKILGIDVALTFYVARHSYATKLKRGNADIAKISEAMGHRDINITNAYLKGFENSEIDELDNLL
jgi:integrase/recombinase XerD